MNGISHHESSFPQSGGVQKSVTDDREFRYVVLPNGLRVTLVSDSKADKVWWN